VGADRGRPLHLVRGANTALDSVRRERQREHGRRKPKGARRSGHGASWRRDLYRARHRRLKARERLTERERRRLIALFEREPLIAEAWGLKEAFGQSTHHRTAKSRAPARPVPRRGRARAAAGLHRLRRGLRLWRAELLAYFDEPTTNGYAEGVINKVKVIKRRAYGLPTFDGFGERVLLACA
jgi:transposase